MSDREPPFDVESQNPLDNPLAQRLENVLTRAYQRYSSLFASVDPNTLPEPERSGVIFLNTSLQATLEGKKAEYFFPEDLIVDQTSAIKRFVESLPAYIPYIFSDYADEVATIPTNTFDLLISLCANYETEEYFGPNGTHELVLECLRLATTKPAYMQQTTINDTTIPTIAMEKLLGSSIDKYTHAPTLVDAMNLLSAQIRKVNRET